MSKLFEPLEINRLQLKNRFVRSATLDSLGRDAKVTSVQLSRYRLQDMEQVLEERSGDAVSLGRPFIMDPHLVKKLREKVVGGLRCTSCNACMKEMHAGIIRCVIV